MGELWAGVGRVDITPPLGVDLMGTSRRAGPASSILDRLVATCLVLSNGSDAIAIVDTDLLALQNPTALEFRERIGEVIGASPHNVLLACSHTHAAPTCSPGMPKIGGDQERIRDEEWAYINYLGFQLEGAARLALNALQPARIAAGRGHSDIAVNRRQILPDGRVVIGRNWEAPCDSEVGVVRIDSLDGGPLAAVVNFAAHPGVLSPVNNHVITGDYPGALRRTVEQITGATCLFLLGAAGNMRTIDSTATNTALIEKVGKELGCEASRVFFGLRTWPIDEREVVWTSIAPNVYYEEVRRDEPALMAFDAGWREVDLPLCPLPELAAAEATLVESERIVNDLRARGATIEELNPPIYHWLAARRVAEFVRSGDRQPSTSAEVQALRINDIAIVAMPGEPFVEVGLAIKARSPFPHTLFAGYSNGTVGYIPTRDAYPLGGYEVEHAHRGYGLPSALEPGSAERMVDIAVDLLSDLHSGGANASVTE